MPDLLFQTLSRWHVGSWGRFLDAGTGTASLQWALTLNTSSITAITADNGMKSTMEKEVGVLTRAEDRILVGNWMDRDFEATLGKFDTILADYLIGAVDGFSPYTQDLVLEKLKAHLTDRGRLYIIGMNPIADVSTYPANIVSEVRRARDAAILLAGHRPYREYPVEWMQRHLERLGFRVVESQKFTIMHTESSILRQLRVGQSKLTFIDSSLRGGMETYLQQLGSRVKSVLASADDQRIPLSFDYVICAELLETSDAAACSQGERDAVLESGDTL